MDIKALILFIQGVIIFVLMIVLIDKRRLQNEDVVHYGEAIVLESKCLKQRTGKDFHGATVELYDCEQYDKLRIYRGKK